ncbi:MAG: CbiX/SirB N-terminal domain-containing protein [Marmoricola sp.]
MTALVLCSHGTRSSVGAARISALVAAVAAELPDVEVREAHVDVHPPYLDDIVEVGDLIVPLLLAPGYHVDVDIHRASMRVSARVTRALGPDPRLTALLCARLDALRPTLAEDDLIVLAAAGSSVQGSEDSVGAAAAELAARLGRRIEVGYGASCQPLLPDLLAALRSRHHGCRIVGLSYLLAPGHFQDRLLATGFDAVTDALLDSEVPDPRLVELVVERYRELAGECAHVQ